MPNLIVDFIISLDGYASAEGWPGCWGMEGPEYLAWVDEGPEHEHATLMGAKTYRLMYGFADRDARRSWRRRPDRTAQGGVLLDPGGPALVGQHRAGRRGRRRGREGR